MDHSIIQPIRISIATLIHRTGTSIYTISHGIATLIYTNNFMTSFLALSSVYSQGNPKDQMQVMTKDLNLILPQDNLQGCEIHQVLA